MNDAKIKAARRYWSATFLKVTIGLIVLFALVRVVIPSLVNAHDDTWDVLGLVLGLLTPVLAGWVAVSVFISTRRFINQSREGQ